MFGGDVFMFPEQTRQYGSTMQGPQQRAPSKTVNVVLISELEPWKESGVESWRPGQQCVAAFELEGCEWEGNHFKTDRLVVRIAVVGVWLIGTDDPIGICQCLTSVSASSGPNISLPVRTTSSTGLLYTPQNSSHNHFLDHYSVLTRLPLISWNWYPTGNDKKPFNDSSKVPGAGSHSSLIPCVLCTQADVPEATPSFVTLSERWLWGWCWCWCWCWWGYKKRAGSLQEAARGTSGASVWGMNTEVDWFIHRSNVWQNFKFTSSDVKTRMHGWSLQSARSTVKWSGM